LPKRKEDTVLNGCVFGTNPPQFKDSSCFEFPRFRHRQWIAAVNRHLSITAWTMLSACLFLTGTQQASAEISWQTQLKTAHAQAQAEGKLLLLHFYDDNCVWCDRLESGAFQTSEVATAIQQNYVPVKIHAGKNPSIASTFKVTRYPTDVIVTTQGQALSHMVSPQDAGRYVAMLAQNAPAATDGTMIASNQTPTAPSQAPVSAEPSYAAAAPNVPVQSAGFAMTPQTAATPVSSITRSSVPESGPTAKAPMGNGSDLELAMDGYCAVTVIEKDRWVEGNPEFGVVHLGRLYLFSDKPSMERFLENPEPYTPILNGIDVVRFFEERKIVPGNREWGLKDPDHNRMFFFADEAALNHFYNQHTRYTDAALAVMAKAVKDANPGK
jgi:YHS domain-containing protein